MSISRFPAFVGRLAAIFVLAILLTGALVSVGPNAARAQSGAETPALVAGTSFNSSFNADHNGWTPVFGTWKLVQSKYYRTLAPFNETASIKHAGTYKNFIFTARLKAAGAASGNPIGLVVRGTPSSLDVHHTWNNGYVFYYTDDGNCAIVKYISGTPSWEGAPAPCSSINQGGWNTLKVVAYGSAFAFYINGTEVWGFYNYGELPSGSVGIMMVGDGTHPLLVDSAKLTVLH